MVIDKQLLAQNKGFTLIELMIVIAIIGILAAVAIPNFISYRNKAYCSSAESDAKSVLSTLADYFAIPIHAGPIVGPLGPGATTLLGVPFAALSNGNTAVLNSPIGQTHTVIVTDTSTRCPLDYRISQQGAGWSIGAAGGTYTKSI